MVLNQLHFLNKFKIKLREKNQEINQHNVINHKEGNFHKNFPYNFHIQPWNVFLGIKNYKNLNLIILERNNQ